MKNQQKKLKNEKDKEINKLKYENELLQKQINKNENNDYSKYINEINKLNSEKMNLEKDLNYFKDLNNNYVNNEKNNMKLKIQA